MHREIAQVHPAIAETFTYMSYDEVDLERLEAERRTEQKRNALKQQPPQPDVPRPPQRLDRSLLWFVAARSRWPMTGATHVDARRPRLELDVLRRFDREAVRGRVHSPCSNGRARSPSTIPHRPNVPDLPEWGERVTIDHLVHHTGGVKERSRSGPGVPVDGVPAWGNEDLLDQLRRVPELDFEPGSRYGYSNRGYLLLAEVVAAASGSSLRAFAQRPHLRAAGHARDVLPGSSQSPVAGRTPSTSHPSSRRDRPRGAGTVPRGGRRRTVDHRERPRALGRQLRRGPSSPTAGCPSGSRNAERSPTARRSTTRGGCRCARIGACRS